jgi:16S rRNA (cytosine967-C5)-methyltransferase
VSVESAWFPLANVPLLTTPNRWTVVVDTCAIWWDRAAVPAGRKDSLPGARDLAARVLERVDRDRAYASRSLDAELARYPQLEQRERALATELVYGSLRTRRVLESRLGRHAPRGLDRLDAWVTAHLVVAAYQILVLDRVPAFAAVDAAVGAIRQARSPRLAGFANAILRRLAASGERLDREEAAWQSLPVWLGERLEARLGADEARALIDRSAVDAMALRLVGESSPPPWLDQAERGRASPRARIVQGVGDPRSLPGYAEGAFVVEEEGSQLVALAVGARPGERVLDACAGHGQKASLLAEAVGPTGTLWAADLHPEKLRRLVEEFARLHLPEPATAAVDWTVGSGAVPGGFDRVLVDAPCSGTGTLRRRPEIALRLGPDDPERLAELAERILRAAARLARPGGRVVFAVCSVLGEEGEAVVARVASELVPAPFDAPELGALVDPGVTSFSLLPGRHGTDGYFVASFVVSR